eukprot:347417-Chlamydomonas_euryale.AAC.1
MRRGSPGGSNKAEDGAVCGCGTECGTERNPLGGGDEWMSGVRRSQTLNASKNCEQRSAYAVLHT